MSNVDGMILFAVGCWGVVIALWIVMAFRAKPTKERSPLPRSLLYLVLTAAAAILLNESTRFIHWNQSILPRGVLTGILGDFLLCVGLVIAVWARITLAGNWSARVSLKEDHELVKRGPYRFVRHPIYSGLLVMVLGTAILVGQVGGFLVLVFCACGLYVKLRREEALLTKHFPGYPEYMRRTKALVPFVL